MKIITIFTLFLLVAGTISSLPAMELPSANLQKITDLAISKPNAGIASFHKRTVDDSNDTDERATVLQEYLCKLCSQKFFSIKDIELHVWRHLGLKPYKCKINAQCKESFDVERNLQSHLAKKHKIQAHAYSTKLTPEDRKKIKEITAEYLPEFDFICKKCDLAFESAKKLDGHRCRILSIEKPEKKLAIKWRV